MNPSLPFALIASKAVIALLATLLILHILILVKALPSNIVWGGRIQSDKELYKKQGISVALTMAFLWAAVENVYPFSGVLSYSSIRIVFWLMVAMFAFSTLGSFTSKNKVEKYLFSTLALLLTLCCLVVVLK